MAHFSPQTQRHTDTSPASLKDIRTESTASKALRPCTRMITVTVTPSHHSDASAQTLGAKCMIVQQQVWDYFERPGLQFSSFQSTMLGLADTPRIVEFVWIELR